MYRNIQTERVSFGKHGMTQEELGRLVGRSGASISNIETGKTQMLLADAIAFARHFDFSLDWFICRDVPRNNHKPQALVESMIAALPGAIEKGEVVVEKYIPDWAAGHNFAEALRNRHEMCPQAALNYVLRKLDEVTADPASFAVRDREYQLRFYPVCEWEKLDRSWREAFCNGLKGYGFTFTFDTKLGTVTVRW